MKILINTINQRENSVIVIVFKKMHNLNLFQNIQNNLIIMRLKHNK